MLKAVLLFAALVVAVAAFVPDFMERLAHNNPPASAQAAAEGAPAVQVASYGGTVRLKADKNGHYSTKIEVNNQPLDALVDTGATFIALRYEDARSLGLVFPGDQFDIRIGTANGEARAKSVKLRSVTLGTITVRDVDAMVLEQGRLSTNLLGMSFLKRLGRYEFQRGQLVLEE
jgi:aspartyl protease family protein